MSNRCSISNGECFDLIPIDLIISNILSRLPLKSMARCRCISKLWSSIIRRPNYNHLFPDKSTYQPRFLFTFVVDESLLFFSLPQHDQLESVKSSLVATHHRTVSVKDYYKLCPPVQGLVCSQLTGSDHDYVPGESVTTPKVPMKGMEAEMYFGFDPIDKMFKVLCITWEVRGKEKKLSSLQHQVLTLETGNGNLFIWRKIQSCNPYYPLCNDGICINGVLYFAAKSDQEERFIVFFDVRFEKFGFIHIDQELAAKIHKHLILVNYKGKLGAINYDTMHGLFELWVLEDVEEHKWSKNNYEKPVYWPEIYSMYYYSAGATSGGEILFYQNCVADRYHIFYYDLERNNMARVRVVFFLKKGILLKSIGIDYNMVQT